MNFRLLHNVLFLGLIASIFDLLNSSPFAEYISLSSFLPSSNRLQSRSRWFTVKSARQSSHLGPLVNMHLGLLRISLFLFLNIPEIGILLCLMVGINSLEWWPNCVHSLSISSFMLSRIIELISEGPNLQSTSISAWPVACFANSSALSLPGMPTWAGIHANTMSMELWQRTACVSLMLLIISALSLPTSSARIACRADRESEKTAIFL